MGVCRPRKRETRIHIGCRDKVASSSVVIFFYGIEGHDVSRILRFQVFWLSQYLSAMCLCDSSEMGNLLRKEAESPHILDESANGGDRRDGEVARCAKACQDGVKFFLAEIRMNGTQATNFPKNKRIPFPGPFCFWVRFFSESASILFLPRENLLFQRKSVLLLVFGNASRVTANPYFSQKARMRARSRAFGVIICRYLRASS